MNIEPLLNDKYADSPNERVLDFVVNKRESGAHVAGMYCGYALLELLRAVGAVPVFLCAFSNKTIAEAETVLPVNLCPHKHNLPFLKVETDFTESDRAMIYTRVQALLEMCG